MNNQLIKREDISIFDKIKGFFRRLFNKKTKKNVVTENKEQYSAEKVNEFEKSLRVDELKEFINKIETNPDIIENLSNDRLDKLIVYYESITNAKRIKIEKLKSQIG